MSFWETSVGGVPVIGSIINGAKAVANFGMAGIDGLTGETESAKDHLAAGALDTVKAIPYVGSAVSVGEFFNDMHAGRPTEEHLFDPTAPAYQPSLEEDVREWMFGRKPEGPQVKSVAPRWPVDETEPGPEGAPGRRW